MSKVTEPALGGLGFRFGSTSPQRPRQKLLEHMPPGGGFSLYICIFTVGSLASFSSLLKGHLLKNCSPSPNTPPLLPCFSVLCNIRHLLT